MCKFRGETREQEEAERIKQKCTVILEAEEERARRVAEDLALDEKKIKRTNEFKGMLQNQFTGALKKLSKEIHLYAEMVADESVELRPARKKILEVSCGEK